MRSYDKRHHALAFGLASLAGFVDALAFIRLGGLFVSFMSGNSTRLAADAVGHVHRGVLVAGLMISFVGGVMVGSVVGILAGRWRKPAVLVVVSALLTLAAIMASFTRSAVDATFFMAAAMGAANDVFQRDGEVSVGVTYMTGTLVKFGQHAVAALRSGPRFSWLPYLMLWLGLIAGAMAGAAVFPLFGLSALWIAVGYSLLLGLGAAALGPVVSSEN